MSTTSQDSRVTEYAPVVETTEFPVLFPVFDDSDIAVFVDDIERFDFTLTADFEEGFTTDAVVVFEEGIIGDVRIVGRRIPRRSSRFREGFPLPVRDQNLALDTMQAEIQEARRDIDRSVKLALGGGAPADVVAVPGYVLGFSSGGDLTTLQSVPAGNIAFTLFGRSVAQAASSTEFSTLYAPTVWTGGKSRSDQSRLRDTCKTADFNVDLTGNNDSTSEMIKWRDAAEAAGVIAEVSPGIHIISGNEFYLGKTRALNIIGHGSGSRRRAMKENKWQNWGHQSTIGWVGGGRRYQSSRRRASEPGVGTGDLPQNIAFHNVQEGTRIRGVAFMQMDVDWSDTSTSSLGGDIDHIFYNRRCDLHLDDVAILGYGRVGTLTHDVTGHPLLPEFTDPDGFTYPTPSVKHGIDGFRAHECFLWGAKGWTHFLRGGILGSGAYYDPISGLTVGDLPGDRDTAWASGKDYAVGDTLIYGGNSYVCTTAHTSGGVFDGTKFSMLGIGTDCRGGYGSSDFYFTGVVINRHHSGEKLYTTPGTLPEALPDTDSIPAGATGCFLVDGICGNTSGRIQNITTAYTRYSSKEEFRVFIRRANRYLGFNNHYDYEGDNNNAYGPVAWSSETRRPTEISNGGLMKPAYTTDKVPAGSYSIVAPDAGDSNIGPIIAPSVSSVEGELALNSKTTSDAVRLKNGSVTALLSDQTVTRTYSGRLQLGGSSSDPIIIRGSGSPQGAVTAPVGSEYTRTDTPTTSNQRKYWKESGTGNTGWVAVF